MALLRFFEDEGVEFIDEKDSLGVRVGKKIIKQKSRACLQTYLVLYSVLFLLFF
jgi:hypothetical protein